MKTTTTRRTEQQIAALSKLAKRTGIAVAEHERRAIDEYLERQQRRSVRG